MMKKLLKNKNLYVKQKYTLQKFLNKLLLISSIFIALSCTILPEGYDENLTSGTWINIEKINTPTGVDTIESKSTFSTDGIYDIEIDDPTAPLGPVIQKFFYETGYYVSKYAIVLYEYSDITGANPPVIGTPIYFHFKDDFKTLITSTNENMSFSQEWQK